MSTKALKPAPACQPACPVRRSADVLGSKWTLLVVRDLLGGPRRYGELLRSIDGISPKVLAGRLHMLEERGVLVRTQFAEIPLHVEYELTDRGHGLRAVIEALAAWGSTLPVAAQPNGHDPTSLPWRSDDLDRPQL